MLAQFAASECVEPSNHSNGGKLRLVSLLLAIVSMLCSYAEVWKFGQKLIWPDARVARAGASIWYIPNY